MDRRHFLKSLGVGAAAIAWNPLRVLVSLDEEKGQWTAWSSTVTLDPGEEAMVQLNWGQERDADILIGIHGTLGNETVDEMPLVEWQVRGYKTPLFKKKNDQRNRITFPISSIYKFKVKVNCPVKMVMEMSWRKSTLDLDGSMVTRKFSHVYKRRLIAKKEDI